MNVPRARAGAAFAVIAASLMGQCGHVVASVGYVLGNAFAPTWQSAVAAHATGTVVGAGIALAATILALRHVTRGDAPPSLVLGIVAAGVAIGSYVGATILGAAGAMSIQQRVDDWATEGEPVGDMIVSVTYATGALQLASGLFGLALAIGSLVWLWSRGRVTIPG